jgi:hypothetical protein
MRIAAGWLCEPFDIPDAYKIRSSDMTPNLPIKTGKEFQL